MANESYFHIQVHLPQTRFREIKQIRAYDIESLVGHIGGYMGLFLGYALLNFPNAFHALFGFVKKKILNVKRSTPSNDNNVADSRLEDNIVMMVATTTA